jgi:hypothetical protein
LVFIRREISKISACVVIVRLLVWVSRRELPGGATGAELEKRLQGSPEFGSIFSGSKDLR